MKNRTVRFDGMKLDPIRQVFVIEYQIGDVKKTHEIPKNKSTKINFEKWKQQFRDEAAALVEDLNGE